MQRKLAFAIFRLCLFVGIVRAQDSPSSVTVGRQIDAVSLTFAVTDTHGRFVPDIQQHQLKILDNGEAPNEIVSFEAQTGLPLRVGLLFDASHAVRQRFLFEQEAASNILREVVRTQSDRAFVLAFDEVPEVTQEFTNDGTKLASSISAIRPGGGTAVWDAVYWACRDTMMKDKNIAPVRRVIVLLSSGDDDHSHVRPLEAKWAAQRAGVTVYAISANLGNFHGQGEKDLQMLAEATGGRAFFPLKLEDFANDLSEIQRELQNQYSLTYKPNHFIPNGEFHTVRIMVERPELTVRAPKAYFAPMR